MPKASVIIPVYNGAPFVGKAITSVLEQTHSDLELIVVDDGSTDDTRVAVTAFTDPRLRYVARENGGPSAARNTGLRYATGDWVAVLDSDDWWAPTKLEAQLARAAESPDAALIYTAVAVVNQAGRIEVEVHASADGEVLDELLHRNLMINSSVMVRRDVLERVGGWDETIHYGEDWELWLRIAAEYPLASVDSPLTYQLRRPHSQGSNAERMRDSCLNLLERAFATYARSRRHLRTRALAEVYYRSASQLHDENDDKAAASRDLLRTLRRNPFHFAAYRRLIRLGLSVAAYRRAITMELG